MLYKMSKFVINFFMFSVIFTLSCSMPINNITNEPKKLNTKYIDNDGSYYGYDEVTINNPMDCYNENYYFNLSTSTDNNGTLDNQGDEEISIYINDILIIKRSSTANNTFYGINHYLSKGRNKIHYQVFNKSGGYSWYIKLKDYGAGFGVSTVPVEEDYIISEVFTTNDTSKENQIVKEGSVYIDVCKNSNEPPDIEGPYITDSEYYPHGKNVNYNSYTFQVKANVCR